MVKNRFSVLVFAPAICSFAHHIVLDVLNKNEREILWAVINFQHLRRRYAKLVM